MPEILIRMSQEAQYIGSYVKLEELPQTNLPEFAFIGRSNVGKSTLINRLLGRKNLAHTSSQPGKTRTINFFSLGQDRYYVDLPGYGYAKTSQAQRQQWLQMVYNYLTNRPQLACVFVLIDASIPPQTIDLAFVDRLGEYGVPFCLVFTKIDKASTKDIQRNIRNFREKMQQHWEELPPQFQISALKNRGVDQLREYIDSIVANSQAYLQTSMP